MRISAKAPTVVCVIGTPRSGTSLTARILNLAGVYLGPESEMVPANRWNSKGFWENRGIVALNRRLLKSLRRDDLAPPKLPPGWATSEALEGERADARALLAETFEGHELWGWKDAGTTLVLPFWQQLVPRMRYVVCLRNPVDVARSAERIEGLTAARALDAWAAHLSAAFAYTAGQQRLLVSYDDYLNARRPTVERLWRFTGNEGAPSEAEAQRLEAPIDEELLHHRTSPVQTLLDESLPLGTNSTFLIAVLLRLAIPEPSAAEGKLAELQAAVDVHAARILDE